MLLLRRKFGGKEEVRPEFTPCLSVLTVEILAASVSMEFLMTWKRQVLMFASASILSQSILYLASVESSSTADG